MIILGTGILYIGANPVALSRGGGQFTVEREYRNIEADGDKGPVKGRIVCEGSIAKLQMNVLEFVAADMVKLYPGLASATATGTTTITADTTIGTTDYNDTVTWKGKTKEGKAVEIIINDAINLENMDWSLAPKDDVVQSVTFTACYDDADQTGLEPWSIKFTD